MAEKLGSEIRNIVRVYTNIDTHDLYKWKLNRIFDERYEQVL
jgi:hypothetical protein